MNRRVLGTVKREWGSGAKLFLRGWAYVFGAFLFLNYVVPVVWSHITAIFR